MLWLWLLQGAHAVVSWVVSWFPEWEIPYPEGGIAADIPVPLGLGGSELGTWVVVTLAVCAVLMVGRLLTWIYEKIPFI